MVVQETIIKDIVDLASSLKDTDAIELITGKKSDRSIKSLMSKGKDLTLVFPVICSKHMSIDTATIIAKAIERQAATMIQIVIAACSITDESNAYDFISRFHSNLDTGSFTIDKLIDSVDKLVDEGVIETRPIYEKIKRELSELTYVGQYYNDDINKSPLSRYSVSNICGESVVLEDGAPYMDMDDMKSYSQILKYSMDATKAINDIKKNALIPTDVKKANELIPTMMALTFDYKTEEGRVYREVFIIGVKAKIYPVDSADILNRIKVKRSDKNLVLNLIKAATKETRFIKDFVFALDRAKLDAASQSVIGGSSKLWKVLERRALKSRIRRSFYMKNDATAITTIAITQDEVDYLLKTTGINIEDSNEVRIILEAYNLMGFVIADEVSEYAKFIFDSGDDMYESVSFQSLERDTGDGSTKKIINMMNKVSR